MIEMPSAIGAGKLRRASRIFRPDGKAALIAIDMQMSSGKGPDLDVVEKVAAGGADGILATWQIARKYPTAFADSGLILRIDGALSQLGAWPASDTFSLMYNAEQAATIGADAVALMAFPGATDEQLSLQRLATVVGECEKLGMPVIAESIPGAFEQAIPHDRENIARCARICVEMGADMVKTPAPPDIDDLGEVLESVEVPVFILGGPKMASEDDAVAYARSVVAAGADGIAFGRNAWMAADVTHMVSRLNDAVHGLKV